MQSILGFDPTWGHLLFAVFGALVYDFIENVVLNDELSSRWFARRNVWIRIMVLALIALGIGLYNLTPVAAIALTAGVILVVIAILIRNGSSKEEDNETTPSSKTRSARKKE